MVDNAFVVVDFEGGARGMLDLCMFAEGARWQEEIAVTGELARADAFVPGPPRFRVGADHASEFRLSDRATHDVEVERFELDPRVLAAGDHHGSTLQQHERFAALVRAGHGKPEVGLVDGYWAVHVGEAAERSIRTGEVVVLDREC